MINFFELEFKRITAHRIEAKTEDQPNSIALPAQAMLTLDAETEYKIKEKLFDAADKKNKSFNLNIGSHGSTSFWGLASELENASDNDFISETGRISLLLAEAQTTGNIKQSYIITIDARSADSGRFVFICIKAELNEAFVYREGEIRLIDDLFMTPETKLFKFGMIYRLEPWERLDELEGEQNSDDLEVSELEQINKDWSAFLFDDQFRADSKPAAYFWRDFLGFSLENNGKIQSKRFYDATEKFLEANIPDYQERATFLQALDLELSSTDEEVFSPEEFTDSYVHDRDLNEIFRQQVSSKMPPLIAKDIALIQSKINNKKILFPGKVKISAPSSVIETNIEIIDSQEELQNLSTQQESYTIVKIMGKPSVKQFKDDSEGKDGRPQYILNDDDEG
ncbi:MAG: nucleoid-associated protein [Candidatus Kapaibacteriales bacterium]